MTYKELIEVLDAHSRGAISREEARRRIYDDDEPLNKEKKLPVAEKKPATMTNKLGQEFTLDFKDVTFATTKGGMILIPDGMSLSEAIFWMELKQRDEETIVEVNERIEGYPIDVAWALQLAIKKLFGIRELRSTPGLFGEKPPSFISVPINHKGEMVEIFLGRFGIPGAEGYLESSRDFNDALWIRGKLKQKSLPVMRKLLTETRATLVTESLYKGKAFRVYMTEETQGFETKVTMANPEFIDVSHKPTNLLLNRDTTDLLETALWRPISRSRQTRHYNPGSLKRSVGLFGKYGTGKTLTAMETAAVAQENGWTFIFLNDVKDLKRVYPFAARYAPSVLFAEDIDLVVKHAGENNEDGINMLNNVLDGIDTKDKDIILVLTTNHIEDLPNSMLRFGRFDTLIEYQLPDPSTAAKLVHQYAGGDLDDDFDDLEIGDILAGNQPSTIHEIVKRAKLFSQGRYPEDYRGPLKLTTRDLILANQTMQAHLKLLNRTPQKNPSGMEQFGNAAGRYLYQGVYQAIRGRDPLGSPSFRAQQEEVERDVSRPAAMNFVGEEELPVEQP